jgi:GT2 family glycosyltransferase
MTAAPTFLLAIPTMNRPDSLRRTLAVIAEGARLPEAVLVVDQSEPSAAEQVRAVCAASPLAVRCLHSSVRSLTAARNKALDEGGDFTHIVFLDDDVDLAPDALANAQALFSRRPSLALVGFKVGTLTPPSPPRSLRRLLGRLFLRAGDDRPAAYVSRAILGHMPNAFAGEIPAQWAMGCSIVDLRYLRRTGIRFDETFAGHAYPEDLDFSWRFIARARADGREAVISADVRLLHLVSSEWRMPRTESARQFIDHRYAVLRKHHAGPAFYVALACFYWANVGELLIWLRNGRLPWAPLWFMLRLIPRALLRLSPRA